METLCKRFTRHRRTLMALLFLMLEATSFVLDQIGGNQSGFLIASFVLSVISFLMTGYTAMGTITDFERDRIMIELAFSVVQLIITYIYLALSIFRVRFKSNIASIFPLVLAATSLILAYRHNELVQDPTPNTQERDEEEGFAGIPDNLSRVNREEEIPDTGAFISHVDTSTVVNETPDSTTQSSIMVNEEETARFTKQEEISETSRASLISSDAPMMSKHREHHSLPIAILTAKRSDVNVEIAGPTAAPTPPSISSETKIHRSGSA